MYLSWRRLIGTQGEVDTAGGLHKLDDHLGVWDLTTAPGVNRKALLFVLSSPQDGAESVAWTRREV